MAAQQACLDALEGTISAESAREAFVSAALASKIYIRANGDPREAAMRAGTVDLPGDSPAFRRANRDAMASIKRIVEKHKNKRPG